MREWKRELEAFGADSIDIAHNMTPRYFRALAQRGWIVKEGQILGWKTGERKNCYEVSLWMPHPQGIHKCGFYSAARFFYREDILAAVEIYAFYDGRDESICLKSVHNAQEYSKNWGFHD